MLKSSGTCGKPLKTPQTFRPFYFGVGDDGFGYQRVRNIEEYAC